MPQTAFQVNEQQFIQLEGVSGVFNTVASNFRVRFFSTYANARENNYSQLLDELKPMRERLTIDKIKNITQVLQRDLDDFRIANGLVPYLLNLVKGNNHNPNHIAFFPAILGVIIPKDYLRKQENSESLLQEKVIKYPNYFEENQVGSKNKVISYFSDNKNLPSWKITHLKDGDRVSPLSMLEIDKNLSEIIVLDGQHRANAFRVASKRFFTNPKNEIYRSFYHDSSRMEFPAGIETNLPVTLICFEKVNESSEILPDFISRQLFIDVNNSARPISSSRQVLLDDRDPSSILTNSFYSVVAEKHGFVTNSSSLSLIHLGFDINATMRERKRDIVLNISNPELMNIVFDWYFFAPRTYNELKRYSVAAEQSLKWQPNIFDTLMPLSRPFIDETRDEENYRIKILLNSDKRESITEEFREKHFSSVYLILNSLNFLRAHYSATSELQQIRDTNAWNSDKKSVWDEVFKGGEGLYYSFKKLLDLTSGSGRADLIDKDTAINEIDKQFREIRAKNCGLTVEQTDALFSSFSTVAFQVALFMGFWNYVGSNTDYEDVEEINNLATSYVEDLNKVSITKWYKIFTVIRQYLWGGDTDPKKWPSYHKIILRLIQGEGEFFDTTDNYNLSPEAEIFRNMFNGKFSGFLKEKYTDSDLASLTYDAFILKHKKSVIDWQSICRAETESIFKVHLDIDPLPYDYVHLSETCMKSRLL